jgi:predicted ATPase
MPPPSLHVFRRVALRNYRSIQRCDVTLEPLTFLVGLNGSGKSNFLDALRLSAEGLRGTLEQALRERGGISEVRRRSTGHPTDFAVSLSLVLGGRAAHWAYEVGALKGGGFRIKREQMIVGEHRVEVEEGRVVSRTTAAALPPGAPDRFYLVSASALPEFRPLFDALTGMGFYNIQPAQVSAPQVPDAGELLRRDGGNLASVLRRLKSARGGDAILKDILAFLSMITPGVEGVEPLDLGHLVTLEFRQTVEGSPNPWRFPAIAMSDGTLRALALLTAMFQPAMQDHAHLIGIEEPEVALHPAAAGVLFDALTRASHTAQLLVTSHSPDLLDHPGLQAAQLRVVELREGVTHIGQPNPVIKDAIQEQLYTGGELLRTNGLGSVEDHTKPPLIFLPKRRA